MVGEPTAAAPSMKPVRRFAGGPYTEYVVRLEELNRRYREHHRHRGRHFVYGGDERADLFRHYVGGPGRRVLDVGCRYGALTRAYLVGNEVVGVDVDRWALDEARELGIETRWVDAEGPLPFEDASFDVVVAGELLEHIRDPAVHIREAHRVLRPGGTLVGSVPNAYRLKNRLRFLAGRSPENNPTHLHMFSPQELLDLLSEFDEPRLHFISSRFLRFHPRLTANIVVFAGRKPLSALHRATVESSRPRSSVDRAAVS
jgi:SAM-dependent methyltransferase